MKHPIYLRIASLLLSGSLFLGGCESESPAPGANSESPPAAEAEKETETAGMQVDHVDAAKAADLLAAGDAVPIVVDVRTPEEFAEGHIEGATSIDFNGPDFEAKLGELDPEKTYLVHCASGRRSTSSLEVFEKLGFQRVIHLDGGFNGWKAAGKPVAK